MRADALVAARLPHRLLRGLRLWLLAVALALGMANAARAQITLVAVATPDPPSNAVSSLTIPAPAGVVANDVLLALVADRNGDTGGIASAPAGWSLVTSTRDGARLGMYLYLKVAAAGEPVDYTWTFTASSRSAAAIMAFRGVDTASPVVTSGSQVNGASTSITAPSITPGVANTMLVGFWANINGNAVLTAPGSMSTAFLLAATGAGPNGLALLGASAIHAPTTATGTRVATSSLSLAGTGHLVALRPGAAPPVAPGGFNAFETSTPAGAISGVIKTKLAGAPFTLSVVALNTTRTAVATTFTGNVAVQLLDASNNSGALDAASGCRGTWTPILAVSPDPQFVAASNGRINVGFSVANAWRDVRVRVTYTGTSTVVGCSTDNFAIRPASFASVQALDGNDAVIGLSRALDNAAAASGVVHLAGRPFSVLAQAVSATGAATSGYSGVPVLAATGCVLPAGCAAGALASTLTGSAGNVTGSATYMEAGVITALLSDADFAAVDAADSTAAERTVASGAVTIGRFVPDAYRLTVATAPQFVAPLCAAGPGRQGFNFVGQPFSFGTAPVVLATPLNAAGSDLANARPRYGAAHVNNAVTAAGAPVALAGVTSVAGIAHGATSLISFDAGSFTFARGTAPVPSFTPTLSMTVNLADSTETATAGNSTINALAPLVITPIDFAAAAGNFHYGRAQLRSTLGDVRRELYVPLEIQRFNGLGWVALTEAGSCFVAAATAFAYSNATGLLTSGGGAPNCASRVAAPVTTAGGRAAIRLDKPGAVTSNEPSAMTMTLNLLATAAGTSCSGATPTAATTVNAPWLANPDGTNPSARVTWGRARSDLIGVREQFD
jgi:MSHA biogenesis protein MshQ